MARHPHNKPIAGSSRLSEIEDANGRTRGSKRAPRKANLVNVQRREMRAIAMVICHAGVMKAMSSI